MEPTERILGVEEARGSLGRLVDEVARTGEAISLTKRGRALAVLVSRSEYEELRAAAVARARELLADRLVRVRDDVERAGLDASAVEEAIAAAREFR